MNKNIMIILAMSLLVFGGIYWMANAHSGSAAAGTRTLSGDVGALAGAPTGGSAEPSGAAPSNGVQVVSVHAGPGGYDHPMLEVNAGQPVELQFSADNAGCGAQFIMGSFNVNLISRNGEVQVAKFTPTTPGTYDYNCPMRMFRGKLKVVGPGGV
jgi:hypothetical protein